MPAADDPHASDRAAGFSSHRARVTVLDELSEVLPGSVGRWYVYSAKTLHIVKLGPLFGRVEGGDLDEHSTYLRVPGTDSRPFRDDGRICALTRIDAYPRLGARFVFRYQRLDLPHRFEERHATSPVRRIERVSLM
jgi:hypothetical protein